MHALDELAKILCSGNSCSRANLASASEPEPRVVTFGIYFGETGLTARSSTAISKPLSTPIQVDLAVLTATAVTPL
jgi:hypothetical protein